MTDTARPQAHAFRLQGVEALADAAGVLILPASSTLIVSDLHFEKGSAYAARGQLIPPYDTRSTLRRLTERIAYHRPQRVIALGDSFHDLGADGRMDAADATALQALVASVDEWVWIEGNHDPAPPSRFGGNRIHELSIDALILRHLPAECAAPLHGLHDAACHGQLFAPEEVLRVTLGHWCVHWPELQVVNVDARAVEATA